MAANGPRTRASSPLSRGVIRRVALGLVLSTAAVWLELSLASVLPPAPFLLLYPAVFVAAWLGGRAAGLSAVVASLFAVPFWILSPTRSFAVDLARDAGDLFIFVVTSVGIVLLTTRMQGAVRQATVAREEAERANAAKDAVLAVVAHDLRNPLQTIGLSVDRLERELGESEHASTTLQRMSRAVRQVHFLVQNVLESAQLVASPFRIEPTTSPLATLVEESLLPFQHLAEARSVTLELPSATALRGDVVCDRDRIDQVLSNLVGNALRYTPRGGRIAVTASRLADGAIELAVTDTGPGMTEDELAHAFERSWHGSGPGHGTGLGLWIAKSLVEAHGGRLSLTSKLGNGTRARIVLPQPATAPGATPAVPVPSTS